MKRPNKKTIAWWLVAALIGGIGADCNGVGDDGQGGDPHDPPAVERVDRPNCPGVVWSDPAERCFTLQTFLNGAQGPYDVYLTIDALDGAKPAVYPDHVPIAGGGWTHSVKYRQGAKYRIHMAMWHEGAPPQGDAWCSITDGTTLHKDRLKSLRVAGGAPYQADCWHTTEQ